MLLAILLAIDSGLNLLMGLVSVSIAIMFALSVIAYMLGNSLRKSDWVAFAKVEMVEIIKTAIIFGAIVGFYFFMVTVSNYVFKSAGINIGSTDIITYTIILLRDIQDVALRSFIRLAEMEHQMRLFSDAAGKTAPGSTSIQIRLMVGADVMEGSLAMLNYVTLVAIHSLNAQIIGLSLVMLLTSYVFFPVGAILRTFPLTRNAGNELIAIGVVASIIIPFMYVLMISMAVDVIRLHSPHGWDQILYKTEAEKPNSGFFAYLSDLAGKIQHGLEKLAIFTSPYMYIVPYNVIIILPKVGWILFFAIALPSFIINMAGSMIRAVSSFLDLDINLNLMG